MQQLSHCARGPKFVLDAFEIAAGNAEAMQVAKVLERRHLRVFHTLQRSKVGGDGDEILNL